MTSSTAPRARAVLWTSSSVRCRCRVVGRTAASCGGIRTVRRAEREKDRTPLPGNGGGVRSFSASRMTRCPVALSQHASPRLPFPTARPACVPSGREVRPPGGSLDKSPGGIPLAVFSRGLAWGRRPVLDRVVPTSPTRPSKRVSVGLCGREGFGFHVGEGGDAWSRATEQRLACPKRLTVLRVNVVKPVDAGPLKVPLIEVVVAAEDTVAA